MNEYGVPEVFASEAKGSLKAVYADIQNVLKVPIVHFIFRTLAGYEQFLTIGWKQIRPNMLTFEAKRSAEILRYPDLTVNVPSIDWSRYYEKRVLDRLRSTVFMFNYVNPKLLLIASAWAESLAVRPNKGQKKVKGTLNPGILSGLPSVDLVNILEAPPPIGELLLDITKKHRHYEPSSDYRAFAHYPQFLRLAWTHLRRFVGSAEYTLIRERLLWQSVQQTKSLPYPVTVDRAILEKYYSPAEIAGIMGIVSMFQNVLPDLIIDGEFFRRILIT
ncbi:MAG TPA: halocarboxylic acid dehydrogenase DehI family protein [Bacillales bacterium]|nr:halocarboxylic acid dehydrogenase DehI family protein [Bacillales bacterium]